MCTKRDLSLFELYNQRNEVTSLRITPTSQTLRFT